ncbi:alanine racemase [Micromonospora sp. NPDC005305]|uniref:alanine racemase n=1 Tax=Micromonospora sp. NPDC005305 TaxID=3156875 RepID=UPI0033BCD547
MDSVVDQQLPVRRMLERNPNLIKAAIELHQSGRIPAATYVLDLDTIAANARAMADVAARLGLRVYAMTKQDGHNPYLARTVLEQGLDGIVAVEAIEANILHRFGLPVSHVGHLSNIPRHQVPKMVAMHPDAITVFSYEAAKAVSDAAREQDRTQGLYVRVNRPGDEIFAGMVGGWHEDTCVEDIRPVLDLPNVYVAGLTMHPCISYKDTDPRTVEPTDAFFTMLRAKEKLEKGLGLSDLRVNCAANCNSATFETLARYGATDVEPGSGVTGSSLYHLYHDLAERPAQVYVSEVMHHWEGDAYTLGGGLTWLYSPDQWTPQCLVGSTFEQAAERVMALRLKGVVDYFGACADPGRTAQIGDTAVYPLLLPQMFMNRSYVAAVSGISRDEPKVEGLFDSASNELDENFVPLPPQETRARIERVARSYTTGSDSRVS